MIAITLASVSGINRIYRIAVFSGDGLVKALLKLDKTINENTISATLKNLEDLLKSQNWTVVEGVRDVAICDFSYRAKSWQGSRVLKAMRSVKDYVEVS